MPLDEEVVERVLLAAEQIPPGRVASYGDLAGIVGTGPRQVGAVLSRHGSAVCWWRVTNSSGEFPADLLARALPHWDDEEISRKPSGRGCRMSHYRADLVRLAHDFDAAWARWSREYG